MTANQAPLPNFSFRSLANYAGPKEGGSDVLPFDGPVAADVVGVEFGRANKPPHNPQIILTFRSVEEDCAGATLKKWTPYSGVDKNQQDISYMFADACVRCGIWKTEEIAQHAAAHPDGELTREQMTELFMGKRAYLDVRGDVDDKGKDVSNIENMISLEKYTELKKTPGMFRKPRSTGGQKTTGGSSAPTPGLVNIGGPKPSALGAVPPPQQNTLPGPGTNGGPAKQGGLPLPGLAGTLPKIGQSA